VTWLAEAAERLGRPLPRLGDRFERPADLYRVLEPASVETAATRLIDDQLAAFRDGVIDRLILTVPPQQGKSERCSRTLPLWLLLDDPSRRIVLASYEKEIATRWGRRVRTDVLTHNGDEGTVDLGLRVRTDTWAADRWQLEGHLGSMTTVGVGSALTGRPADVLLIDDPLRDRQQANSKLYRDRVWDWWTSTARTRLAPGAPVCVVLTRWHEDDLAGRLLAEAGDRWTLLNIPALSEGDGDPLGRPEGVWLTSTRGTTVQQWEETRRDVGEQDFAALYQGHPTPAAGGLFKRKHFRYWQATADPWTVHLTGRDTDGSPHIPGRPGPDEDLRTAFRFITVDLAASTRTSADWSVAAAWAVAGTGELLLLDLMRAQVNPEDHWGEVVGPLASKWNAKIFVEGSQYGTDLVYTAARKGAVVEAVHPDKDKYSRAVPAATRMAQGMILFPPAVHWLPALEAELLSFPMAAHDDMVDVLAYAHRVVGEFWVPPPGHIDMRPRQDPQHVGRACGTSGPDIATAPL
jgi:predicted phage terminase large subunit-like protein